MAAYRRVIKSEEVILLGNDYHPPGGAVVQDNDSDPDYFKKTFSKEITLIEQQSFQKGFSEGVKKGKDLQRQESQHAMNAVTNLIEELNQLKQNILLQAEGEMLELALAVAQKVIHTECAERREIIQSVLRDAIKSIIDRDNLKIRLHPEDYQHIMEIKIEFLSTLDGAKNVVFEQDESIGRGGAVIDTQFGELDARVDQQFNEIRAALNASPNYGKSK